MTQNSRNTFKEKMKSRKGDDMVDVAVNILRMLREMP